MKTQYLIMSTFTKMPSSLIQLNTRSKFLEIYTYFLIKDQFKDNSLKASISEKELAQLTNTSESTIKRYIKDLEPFFESVTKTKSSGEHYYNVYHFTQLNNDFSIVLHTLKDDTELTPEEKGITASAVRHCVATGQEWSNLVPKSVYRYLTENHLDERIGRLEKMRIDEKAIDID